MITLGPLPEAPLGVAVSGGGDSVALLMLLHRAGHTVRVATVDHGLRPEAAEEAAGVARLCAGLGLPHAVLHWQHDTLRGNLQQAARAARLRLLAAWARGHGLRDIVLGHTLDDQAETVLMRLARGSGVDGLAGMAALRRADGLCWHRPLLGARRADLRVFLQKNNISWVDDPSNDDLRYDRVKARRALDLLRPLGLDAPRLATTASHMRRARQALESGMQVLAQACTEITDAGEVQITLKGFAAAAPELQLRLLAAALGWVAGADYRPRFSALDALLAACLRGGDFGKTLHGCAISRRKNTIAINRELAATPPPAPVGPRWDGRWEIAAPPAENHTIRALGEDGLQYCQQWRDSGHSRASLLASPSFWLGGRLLAAPLAQFGHNYRVKLAADAKGFYDALNRGKKTLFNSGNDTV